MLHPVVEGHSLGPSKDMGTCVLLPWSCIMATPELESWIGFGSTSASLNELAGGREQEERSREGEEWGSYWVARWKEGGRQLIQ